MTDIETTEAAGLWLTVTELAEARGIDKSTASRRVTQLEADGLLTARKGPRGSKLVNVASFDKATGSTIDATRALAAGKGGRGAGRVLAHEQARRTAYQADIAELELAERQGQLVRVDDVVTAVSACAETIVLTIEQLAGRAEEIAAAVGRDGPHGARACLKAFAFDVRKSIERAMADLEAKGVAAHAREAEA